MRGADDQRRFVLKLSGLTAIYLPLAAILGFHVMTAAVEVSAPVSGAKPLAKPTIPLAFVENRGQLDPIVRYVLRGPRGSVFFTPDEVVFRILEPEDKASTRAKPSVPEGGADDKADRLSRRGVVVRVSFPGANKDVVIKGRDELSGKRSYLRGGEQDKWIKNVRSYREVVYQNVYPGVDLVYSGERGEIKRKLIVGPKGDVRRVRFKYAGVESVEITPKGDIRLKTAIGVVGEQPPVVERKREGKARSGRVMPRLVGEHEVALDLKDE
jgi:hypothetical protein